MAAQAGLSFTWSKTPKTGFLVTRLICLLDSELFIWSSINVEAVKDSYFLISDREKLKDMYVLKDFLMKYIWDLQNNFKSASFIGFYFSLSTTKSTKMMCAQHAKTQIRVGIHPVWSVFAVRLMHIQGSKVSSYGQQRLWSEWVDT